MIDLKEDIRGKAIECGAVKCGFARCEPLSQHMREIYGNWIAAGRNGEMAYCEKHTEQRNDPRLLLEGANTVICCAFAYGYPGNDACLISEYARGKDYHIALKQRLDLLGQYIQEKYGGETRALVDTAPMRERYWATQCGLGYAGINNQLIIPGIGSRVFLGELLWTGSVEPDAPCRSKCLECMACVRACPGKALDGKGGCDAGRCLSCLTIESRGEIPQDIRMGLTLYGCDACLAACPEGNLYPDGALPEFAPREEILSLTPKSLLEMGSGAYKRLVGGSAMRRVPLPRLKYLAQKYINEANREKRNDSNSNDNREKRNTDFVD
ncbi:MAG: tRNA epoxyqueuosine(34) reductase QueG [Clostridium sp.]|nr:tRNA epoxyqueuosine(34) reductase QueG [Clostridium sp.]